MLRNRRLGKKVELLRLLFDVERYVPDSRTHYRVAHDLKHNKRLCAWLGFQSPTVWSKTASGERPATEAELRKIAKEFHLGELVNDPDRAWLLLTDQMTFQNFAALCVDNRYGVLRDAPDFMVLRGRDKPNRADYRLPLLAIATDYAELQVMRVAVSTERGAMEDDAEKEEELFERVPPGAYYHYRIGSTEEPVSGYLTMIEVTTRSDGSAAAQLIAPSRMHPEPFFSRQIVVPRTASIAPQRNFRMDEVIGLVDAFAFITANPLGDLPSPSEGKRFVPLSAYDVRTIAESLRLSGSRAPIFRGMKTIRVTSSA
jgi:hypothetical protein